MAKKRGLGRGIGALIPSSEPAATEKPEAQSTPTPEPSAKSAGTKAPTSAQRSGASSKSAAPKPAASSSPSKKASDATPAPAEPKASASKPAGTRGADMFFSSESESTDKSSERRRAADLELADSWARDARSKRRNGKKAAAKPAAAARKTGDEGASKTSATAPVEVPSEGDAQVAAATAQPSHDGLVPVPGAEFVEVPIAEIRENPRNPRTVFDEDELDELAYSLREVGVLQPIVVRPVTDSVDGESFEIVMGERRWRAAKRAGLKSIPAIVRSTADDDLLRDALLENLHRSQLNPLEEAAAYGQLLEDFNCTQDELADRIGRSRPQISNTLRLLRLPPLVQRRLQSGALSAGHARALLGLDDVQLQEELAQRIVSEGLSVRAVERLIANGVESSSATRTVTRRSSYNPRVVSLTSQLSTKLEAPVRIDVGKRKGKVTLEFTNLDDLERIVAKLGLEDVELPQD
ncbi:ParB/RepB/Spo0J family partition protein [Dermabacter hominis]|uniref:ParB/RepB/Spo0J family partition protein n=1 Tax=Dermabacter hominis TaxID=36740 RepID=UPI003182E02E